MLVIAEWIEFGRISVTFTKMGFKEYVGKFNLFLKESNPLLLEKAV